MSLNLNNLKIIKKSATTNVDTKINEEVNVKDTKLSKLEDTYILVQKGNMSNKDFQKTIMRNQPTLLTPISDSTRIALNRKLKELSLWYISIKKLIISYSDTKPLIDTNPETLKLKEFRKTLTDLELFLKSERFDKAQSLITKDLLKLFINDDIFKPVFGVSGDLINFLSKTQKNTSFIKEIALCFGLYRKYLAKLSEDFARDIENPSVKDIYFKNIDEVQPRFNMINNHIQTSTPTDGNTLSLNMDIIINQMERESINKNLNIEIQISNMGLKKRLIEINKWLNNGILHTQYSYNRLNNLKVRRNERNNQKYFQPTIDNNYMVWCLLKDIEVFLKSMEDLLIGKSFIIGLDTMENLEVLDVTY